MWHTRPSQMLLHLSFFLKCPYLIRSRPTALSLRSEDDYTCRQEKNRERERHQRREGGVSRLGQVPIVRGLVASSAPVGDYAVLRPLVLPLLCGQGGNRLAALLAAYGAGVCFHAIGIYGRLLGHRAAIPHMTRCRKLAHLFSAANVAYQLLLAAGGARRGAHRLPCALVLRPIRFSLLLDAFPSALMGRGQVERLPR
jgi:hypothetical protein